MNSPFLSLSDESKTKTKEIQVIVQKLCCASGSFVDHVIADLDSSLGPPLPPSNAQLVQIQRQCLGFTQYALGGLEAATGSSSGRVSGKQPIFLESRRVQSLAQDNLGEHVEMEEIVRAVSEHSP